MAMVHDQAMRESTGGTEKKDLLEMTPPLHGWEQSCAQCVWVYVYMGVCIVCDGI